MTKKDYMKPTIRTEELKHCTEILVGSSDSYGMDMQLRGTNNLEEEVDAAW